MAAQRGEYYGIKPFPLRINTHTREWVEQRAVENDITVNGMLNLIIEVGIQSLKDGDQLREYRKRHQGEAHIAR